MRILLKCPTRNRREQCLTNLRKWVELAERPDQLGIALSCDVDDVSMQDVSVEDLPPVAWRAVYRSENRTKIQACNADMNRIDWPWEIVILVSDDMVPQVRGYDDAIRRALPSSDGVVWVNDGIQGHALNTLNIFGRKRYESWGYLYHPDYKSFFCDNEVTDWCREHPKQCQYIPEVLVRHIHPLNGSAPMDALYEKNAPYLKEDERTYLSRKVRRNLGFLNLLSRR